MKYVVYKYSRSRNYGDEIQSIAARQFLPRVDGFVDRDDLTTNPEHRHVKLIANGWYMHDYVGWPPDPNSFDALFVSVHVAPSSYRVFETPQMRDFFKNVGPIGCRDWTTVKFFERMGVDAYFTGCLTLTLSLPKAQPSGECLLVDCPSSVLDAIPVGVRPRTRVVTHEYSSLAVFQQRLSTKVGFEQQPRFMSHAERLLQRYRAAKYVITTRLHCALPCLALGTPVLFLTYSDNDCRFGGLLQHLNSIPAGAFSSYAKKVNWEDPPANPGSHLEIRENLRKACLEFMG